MHAQGDKDCHLLLQLEWLVWPPAQAINFFFVPLHFRVIYCSSIELIWSMVLSYLKHHVSGCTVHCVGLSLHHVSGCTVHCVGLSLITLFRNVFLSVMQSFTAVE